MPAMSSYVTAYSKRADKQPFFNELCKLRDDQRKKKGLKLAAEAYKDAGRKSLETLTHEAQQASEHARSTVKKKTSEPLDEKKFGGMTEEEVCKRELPDHMTPGLDIIFVSVKLARDRLRFEHTSFLVLVDSRYYVCGCESLVCSSLLLPNNFFFNS